MADPAWQGLVPSGLALRPGLRWLLAVAVVLAALAWWWPDSVSRPSRFAAAYPPAVATVPDNSVRAAAASNRTVPVGPDAKAPSVLPAELPRPVFERATFDPFVGMPVQAALPMPRVASQPVAAAPPTPMVALPVAPAPTAPTLAYRYLGRMVGPTGAELVYLVRADTVVPIQVGARLDEGYMVEAIDPTGIRLHYAPLDVRSVIPIAPLPENAIR